MSVKMSHIPQKQATVLPTINDRDLLVSVGGAASRHPIREFFTGVSRWLYADLAALKTGMKAHWTDLSAYEDTARALHGSMVNTHSVPSWGSVIRHMFT